MESKHLTGRAVAFLVLSLLFVLPALQRLLELSEQGALRRVDIALVLAGGFAAGSFFSLAISAFRARRKAAA